MWEIETYLDQIYSAKKAIKNPGGPQDGQSNACAKFQRISLKNGVNMWIFVRRSVKFTSLPWNYLSIVPYGISLILALCSPIFEYLRETFYRYALEYLQSAPSDQKQCKKKCFPTETPDHY